ncbi:hypothetical protein Y1Q_0014242 [Alligator mississippiensis]|uniref:Uncharacterized protein n=1 Tax=Alligator mississippiensis TaxID=8496 RepID=A0A151NGU9_ALLMI|nr:hypothetical protein Y1Q_0014242 [Alligator mississippiensis]
MPGNPEAKSSEAPMSPGLHTLLLAGPDVGSRAHRCLPSAISTDRGQIGSRLRPWEEKQERRHTSRSQLTRREENRANPGKVE